MELTERKKKVLRTVVDLYIRTAEPVGSKAIAAMPDMDYSSATIRNELADLTNLGLLEQPHTSAGRIPSPAGYRLYVDELMQSYRLSLDETKNLNQSMELKMQEFDKMLSQVGKLVSPATDLPAYVVASRRTDVTVRRFELILADAGSVILVVMFTGDVVKNKLIKLPLAVSEADLSLLSALLNATMTDLGAEEFNPRADGKGHAGSEKRRKSGSHHCGVYDFRTAPPAKRGRCPCRADEAFGAAGVPGRRESPGATQRAG